MVKSVSMGVCVQEELGKTEALWGQGVLAGGPRAGRGRAEIRSKSQGLPRSLLLSRTAFPS